jgi:hypothetical protein
LSDPDLPGVLARLEATAALLAAHFRSLPEEALARRPREGAWSDLEVLHHLVYEEREDFRKRLEWTLLRPGEDWPPIDPAGYVDGRRYPDEAPEATLAAFLEERARSVAWLRELAAAGQLDWSAASVHPLAGTMTARDLVACWLAHDQLHLRQLVRNGYQAVQHLTGVAATPYAGDW